MVKSMHVSYRWDTLQSVSVGCGFVPVLAAVQWETCTLHDDFVSNGPGLYVCVCISFFRKYTHYTSLLM